MRLGSQALQGGGLEGCVNRSLHLAPKPCSRISRANGMDHPFFGSQRLKDIAYLDLAWMSGKAIAASGTPFGDDQSLSTQPIENLFQTPRWDSLTLGDTGHLHLAADLMDA